MPFTDSGWMEKEQPTQKKETASGGRCARAPGKMGTDVGCNSAGRGGWRFNLESFLFSFVSRGVYHQKQME
jgi:hypothetical protein